VVPVAFGQLLEARAVEVDPEGVDEIGVPAGDDAAAWK
jgi:hypothetical protein